MIKTGVIGLLVLLVFVNVYFRIKILKYYKRLNRIEVPLKSRHIFSKAKLKEEILEVYTPHKENIEGFVNQIRRLALYVIVLFIMIVSLSIYIATKGSS